MPDIEQKNVGEFDDTQLQAIDRLMVEAHERGIELFPKRQILDNIIIVQEALHSSLMKKEKGMIIKLSMANAYDRVNLGFLTAVLQIFGFSKNAIDITKPVMWVLGLHHWSMEDQVNIFRAQGGLHEGCLPLLSYIS